MESSERTLQAMKWLVELETNQHVERIWPAFDEWFQASAANREEYAWVKLTLLHRRTFVPRSRPTSENPRDKRQDEPKSWVRLFSLDRQVFLVVAAVLLVLMMCLAQQNARTNWHPMMTVDIHQ